MPSNFAIPANPGVGFNFYQTKVPSVATKDYANPSRLGHFNSNITLYDGVGCNSSSPMSLIYFDQGDVSN